MQQSVYLPEGRLLETPQNLELIADEKGVEKAFQQGKYSL